MLTVNAVESRRELLRFVRLPRVLYRGLPGFAPPLDFERLQLLAPDKSPFHTHGEARYWIARLGGVAVGRISAQIDFADPDPDRPGLFGCIDAVDDPTVVAALLAAAQSWLADRGRRVMRGPFTLSINGEAGLLVEGQENGMMLMLPWHPRYLEAHLLAAGLRPVKDLLSYSVSYATVRRGGHHLPAPSARLPGGFVVRGVRPGALASEAEILRSLYNEAWSRNWGFVPLLERETEIMLRAMRPLVFKDAGVAIELDGRVVAFALLLPNLYDLVEGLDGRLLPLGFVRLAWRIMRRRYRSARVMLMGVARSARTAALPLHLISEFVARAQRHEGETIDMGWILPENRPVIRLVEALGGSLSRVHRVYEKGVDPSSGTR